MGGKGPRSSCQANWKSQQRIHTTIEKLSKEYAHNTLILCKSKGSQIMIAILEANLLYACCEWSSKKYFIWVLVGLVEFLLHSIYVHYVLQGSEGSDPTLCPIPDMKPSILTFGYREFFSPNIWSTLTSLYTPKKIIAIVVMLVGVVRTSKWDSRKCPRLLITVCNHMHKGMYYSSVNYST